MKEVKTFDEANAWYEDNGEGVLDVNYYGDYVIYWEHDPEIPTKYEYKDFIDLIEEEYNNGSLIESVSDAIDIFNSKDPPDLIAEDWGNYVVLYDPESLVIPEFFENEKEFIEYVNNLIDETTDFSEENDEELISDAEVERNRIFQLFDANIWNGRLGRVIEMIKGGVDIHAFDDSAYTNALDTAVFRGNLEMTRFFVESGVDIHAQNDKALRKAIKLKYKNIVEYLKQFYSNEEFEKIVKDPMH